MDWPISLIFHLLKRGYGLLELWILGAGFAALLGHCFPVYIGFRDGQGTATVIGIFFILSPIVTAIMFGLMGVALLITRRVILMIWIAAPFLPLLIWLLDGSIVLIIYSLVIITFVAFWNRRGLKDISFLRFNWKQSKDTVS